jgi:hypothetical protein
MKPIQSGVELRSDSQPQRRSELDVLGMVVVVSVVFLHTAQIFMGGDFYVTNEPPAIAAMALAAFVSLWAMPLMFLIAGMAIRYSLLKRSAKEFLIERVRRLLVPLMTGILVVLPPQTYFWLKNNPVYDQSFLQFYPRFFNVRLTASFPLFVEGAPPDELFGISYLYFLIYLFAFSVVLLPLFIFLRSRSGAHLIERMAFFARKGAIYLLALPVVVIEVALGTESPGFWNRYVWIFFITYGFLIARDNGLERALRLHRRSALVVGVITFGIYFAGMGAATELFHVDPLTSYSLAGLLVRFVKGLSSWCWVMAILGMATYRGEAHQGRNPTARHQAGNGRSPKRSIVPRVIRYWRGAQLPFYVLHQLPIVLIGFYVVQWQVTALLKYAVISLGSLVATLLLYDIGVRRTPVTRFLFGMKPTRNS